MVKVQVVTLLDEFQWELETVELPPTREALISLEDLAIAQDEAGEFIVTLSGPILTLWHPGLHWADQPSRQYQGGLEEAVALAQRWLQETLERDDPDAVLILIDPGIFS